MSKNLIVLLGLAAVLSWGVYDSVLSNLQSPQVKRQDTKLEITTESKIGIEKGNRAPSFELETLDGRLIKLSDLYGKKVILNFWATWCPPCKAEMPHMQSFYEDRTGQNVEIIAVNLTNQEKNQGSVEKFANEYDITFPILLDSEGDIGRLYQVVTIPTSYVIDSNGVIQHKIVGPMDKGMMNELITNIN